MYDVGSSRPGGEEAPKGLAVRRQFGPYLLWVYENCVGAPLVREDRGAWTSGVPVVPSGAWRGS